MTDRSRADLQEVAPNGQIEIEVAMSFHGINQGRKQVRPQLPIL